MSEGIKEASRALFHAEYERLTGCTTKEMMFDGEYYWLDHAQTAWYWFNAALDAVEIELPTTYSNPYNSSEKAYNEGVADFAAAIESTNLGLKVKP